jgi:hypothetical protein
MGSLLLHYVVDNKACHKDNSGREIMTLLNDEKI